MKNKKTKSSRVLRILLHKTYLKLLEKTFNFIKFYYIKTREIHPKRNPEIYGSLVSECSLTELRKKDNFLRKLFLKLQQNEFYTDYFVPRELLKLLFLPSFSNMNHYLLIQHHILENGAALQIDLIDYFEYVAKELKEYLKKLSKIYKLINIDKIELINYNMRFVNQKTREYVRNRLLISKIPYQELQGIRHQLMAIQLMLLKAISLAKTKKEIKCLCDDLTSFLFKADELYCGYI